MRTFIISLFLLFTLSLQAQYNPGGGGGGGSGATRSLELSDWAGPIAYTSGFVVRANGTKLTTARLAATDLSDVATLMHLAGAEAVSGVKDFLVLPTGPATTPTLATQFVTKGYVDTFATGLILKTAVRVISTADVTLASAVENGDTLNGVELATGDRVGILFQTAGETNGIYVVKASGAPDRATDYDTAGEAGLGTFFNVLAGTSYSNTQWSNSTAGTITLGVTPLIFSQLSAPATTTASLGVQKVGTDFRLAYTASKGLKLNGNALEIEPDGTTIDVVAAKLAVKSLGTANIATGTATAGYVPAVQGDGSIAWAAQSGGSGGGLASAANGNIFIYGTLTTYLNVVSFSAAVDTAVTFGPKLAVDLTNVSTFKVAVVSGSNQGSINSTIADHYKVWFQYSTDSGVNWVNLDGAAGVGDTSAVSFDNFYSGTTWQSAKPVTTATWINVHAGAKTEVWLRAVNCWTTGGTTGKASYVSSVRLLTGSPAGTRTGVYRTIWIDAGAMVSRTTSGAEFVTTEATTAKQMSDSMDFATGADEFAQFRLALPDEWDRSIVKVKFFWTAASGSGTVKWYIQGIALSNDDAIDTAFGTAVGVEDTLITALDVHVTAATGAITVGGTPALGDVIWWQIYRDVSEDTLDVDAKLLGVEIQYKEGSTEPSVW